MFLEILAGILSPQISYPNWTLLSREISVIQNDELLYGVANVSGSTIVIPADSKDWSFDVWVRGDFPGSGPTWHFSLADETEGPDGSGATSWNDTNLRDGWTFEAGMSVQQFAQWTLTIVYGNPTVTNLDLTPTEIWAKDSVGTYSRNEHNFTGATPYARAVPPLQGSEDPPEGDDE